MEAKIVEYHWLKPLEILQTRNKTKVAAFSVFSLEMARM
jgi:hypothetical protein